MNDACEAQNLTSCDQTAPHYYSYLLRLWSSREGHAAVWHASLEDSHSAERIGFADLEALFLFLKKKTGDPSQSRDGFETASSVL